jgi:hypothetical protein
MANPNQVTGRVFITVSGTRLASKEGAKLDFGGISRAGVAGDTGVHGYTEKTEIPYVECTISHKGDTSLAALQAFTNESVMFQTDTGKTYSLRSAWLAKSLELSKGEVSVRFEGLTCEEA